MFLPASNVDKITDKEIWEKAVIKHFYHKLDLPNEPKEYLFKDLIYCNSCNSKIKKLDDIYCCKKECFKLKRIEIFRLVTKKILSDIHSDILIKNLNTHINLFKKQLDKAKRDLLRIENEKRSLINIYIDNPKSNEVKKAFKDLYIQEMKYKSSINQLGSLINNLNYKINHIEFLEQELINFYNELNSEFLDNNWMFIHDLISNFVTKVVLKKNSYNNGKTIKVQYLKK